MKCVDPTVTSKIARGFPWGRWSLHGLLLSLAGCSVLYELSADQCDTNKDCIALGNKVAGPFCDEGQCREEPDPGTGGSVGDGGSTTTGEAGMTGVGGEAVEGCTSNAECIMENFDAPFICRDGECIRVTSDECPLVLSGEGDESHPRLRVPEPILIGAYSAIGSGASPKTTVPTINYELALEEFHANLGQSSTSPGGLPGGPDSTRRSIVAVICDVVGGDYEASMNHLVDTLQVPGIIAPMYTNELLSVFEQYAQPDDVFMLSPLEADSNLTTLMDDGLLWHMLGSATDLARAYPPLVERTEAYIRGELLGGDDTTQLKVALIEARAPFLQDIGDYIFDNVTFNGMSAFDNQEAGVFLRRAIDSQFEGQVDSDEIADVAAELQDFGPHMVIFATGPEALDANMIVGIEGSLPMRWITLHGDQPRPFYLLSPYQYLWPSTTDSVEIYPDLVNRMLGVNFAAADDPALYNSYISRLDRDYEIDSLPFDIRGTENFYDAAYYMLFSIAGAGNPPGRLKGLDLALGMGRLLDGLPINVGPAGVNPGVTALFADANSTIELNGTLGPPDFNRTTGARVSLPSIYCIGEDSGDFIFEPDIMTYDVESETLEDDPPCVPGF